MKKIKINQNPIFIVGFPRSGTTLLQALLSSQGDIRTFPETHFFDVVFKQLKIKNNFILSSSIEVINAVESKNSKLNEINIDLIRKKLLENKLTVKELLEIIVKNNIESTYKEFELTTRWLEKTPVHYFNLNQIIEFYPNVRIINIIRNPINTFSSWREVSIGWGGTYKPLEEYAFMWMNYTNLIDKFEEKYPNNIKTIYLEDLVDNLEENLFKLCEFVDVEFDKNKIENYKSIALNIRTSEEYWKENVTKNISKNISERNNKNNISDFEKYRLNNILKNNYYFERYKENILLPKINSFINLDEVVTSLEYYQIVFSEQKNKLDVSLQELNQKNQELEQKQKVIEQKNNELKEKNQELEQKQKVIEQKNNELKEKNQELEQKQKVIEQKNNELKEKNQELEQKQKVIEQKNNELKEKNQELEQLLKSIEKVANISVKSSPLKKYNAYKSLVLDYNNIIKKNNVTNS